MHWLSPELPPALVPDLSSCSESDDSDGWTLGSPPIDSEDSSFTCIIPSPVPPRSFGFRHAPSRRNLIPHSIGMDLGEDDAVMFSSSSYSQMKNGKKPTGMGLRKKKRNNVSKEKRLVRGDSEKVLADSELSLDGCLGGF